MEIGIQTMTGYRSTLELARWCESNAIASLAVADHYLAGDDVTRPAYDQLVLMGGIARETSAIELCSLVSPITFRHPAVMLKAGVTLDELSNGRFSLGVGAGWMEKEHAAFGLTLWPMSERFDRLEEALGYLRVAVDGRATGFDGRHYHLDPFVPQPLPHRLRLVVGGQGAVRTPRLAGRYADEYNVFPGGSGTVPSKIATARHTAVEAERDPDALLISTAFPPLVAESAKDLAAQAARLAERRGVDADRITESYDEMGIPYGTPSMLEDGLRSLITQGVTRIYLQVAFQPQAEIANSVAIIRAALDSSSGARGEDRREEPWSSH